MNRKKIGLAVLALALCIGIASAALLEYYGRIITTVTVNPAILLDDMAYPNDITEEFTVTGGDIKLTQHYLESKSSVPITMKFATAYSPDEDGITTTYLKPVEYSLSTTAGGVKNDAVEIDVTDDGTHITWTIDFPGEAPYNDPVTEGNGHWAVGLVIALKGVGEGPAYQIHNTDSNEMTLTDGTPLVVGTWAMSPWGPTTDDGYFGWHSGNINTLVTELDWVSCGGEKHNEDNPDGKFIISINKSVLGDDFHWALNLAIGGGFWDDYMVYEQMAYPQASPGPSFNWGTPIVNDVPKNYEYATLAEEFTELTLEPYEGLGFYIHYEFSEAIDHTILYTITTTVEPES